MTILWFVGAGVLVAILVRGLARSRATRRIGAFSDRRRDGSLLVSRGELIDGNRHLDVALAVTDTMFIFESTETEGTLDRNTIDEVDYTDELATGRVVPGGNVLRLRCSSTTFEFLIPPELLRQWQAVLPPQRMVA